MFWFLLIVYFIGLLVFVGLLQAFNENKDSTGLMLAILGLGIALLLFGGASVVCLLCADASAVVYFLASNSRA